MKECSKCKCEKDEDEMIYYPYLDQWICNECRTIDHEIEEGYLEFIFND